MPSEMLGWPIDKDVDDFITVANNLEKEGQYSRSMAVRYLIERVKLEAKNHAE